MLFCPHLYIWQPAPSLPPPACPRAANSQSDINANKPTRLRTCILSQIVSVLKHLQSHCSRLECFQMINSFCFLFKERSDLCDWGSIISSSKTITIGCEYFLRFQHACLFVRTPPVQNTLSVSVPLRMERGVGGKSPHV